MLASAQTHSVTDRHHAGERAVSFAALHHPEYRPYFVTSLLGAIGDNIEHVISYWVLFQTFQSPMLGGFAVISHWAPLLLLGVYTGSLAQRKSCRRILQFSQGFFMLASLSWGVLFLTGQLQVWHSVVLLSIHGLGTALGGPANQLILHDLVGRDHLHSAVRLNATSRYLSILLGPAIGGGLMLLVGPGWALLMNVMSYVPMAAWLQTVSYSGHSSLARRAGVPQPTFFDLLRQISPQRTLVGMLALSGLSSLLIGNAFQAQMPGFARDLGTTSAGVAYSVLLAANAAGALAAAILLETVGRLQAHSQTALACAIGWCIALGGFTLAGSYPAAVALLFAAGVLNLTFTAMSQTIVQLEAPADIRGQVIGLFNSAQLGMRAISGFTVGVLGEFIGIHWSLGVSAATMLVLTVALWGWLKTVGTALAALPEPERLAPAPPTRAVLG